MVKQSDGTTPSGEDLVYWSRTLPSQSDGIVVVTAWILSKPRQLEHYSRFYATCNWDSLISHPKVFNLWFPELAKTVAVQILDELSQELEKRPRPVVFATFSGGYIGCLWKVYQILQGTCDGVDCTLAKYKTVRDCFAGQMHDSSPAEFVSEVGARFVSSQSVLNTEKRIPIVTKAAYLGGKVLDMFFYKRFHDQNLEMWDVLHKSAKWSPILVLCGKDDDITSFDRIEKFCSTVTNLGCKVTLVAWDQSAHVDHFRRHTNEYKNAVRSFLQDAKTAHSLKRGLQIAGQVELNQTNGYMTELATTSQLLPVGWYEEMNSRSNAIPEHGLLALVKSRL